MMSPRRAPARGRAAAVAAPHVAALAASFMHGRHSQLALQVRVLGRAGVSDLRLSCKP